MQPPNQEKPASRRPSLMPASDSPSADEVRILNSISDGKSKARSSSGDARKPRRVLAIVLLLLLLAAGVTVAALHMNDRDGAATPAQAASAPPVPPLASAAPATAPASTGSEPASAVPPTAAPASAPADAAVINDTNPPVPDPAATSAPRGPDQLTSALEEGVKPPPAALKNALEAKPAKPEKPAKQSAQHDEKKKKTAKAEIRNDSDVDLIKALVARSGEVEKKRSNAATNNASGGNGANADGAAQKSAQAHAGATKSKEARNVDVVERRNGESTASLLQRCHALGFVEGEFCRWRICSGRWDSDPACKVPSADN